MKGMSPSRLIWHRFTLAHTTRIAVYPTRGGALAAFTLKPILEDSLLDSVPAFFSARTASSSSLIVLNGLHFRFSS